MSGLILPAWMTRQPQYAAKLDTSNTLAKNPAFLYLPHYEAVQNAALSLLGTVPPVRTIGPAGFAHFFAGSTAGNSYLSLGTMPGAAVDISRSPCTFVGVFTASSKATVALAQRHDNNATDKGWSFGTTYGSEMGLMLEYGTSNFRKTITDSPTSGINVLVATHDGSQNASNCSVYLNGVLGTVSANTNGAGTSGTDAAQTLFIGQSQFPISVSHSGLIFMVGAFRRQWIATEVAAFSRNPWQIFKAPTRRLWIGASAATSYTLTADSGSYTLTGQAATLKAARLLTAAQGSYSLNGQAAILKAARLIAAGQGSYTLSGQAAILKAARLIAAGQGSYTLTGQAAILKAARLIAAAQGSYTLNGRDASLIYSGSGDKTISAGQGSYALTGQAATLKATRKLAAAQGSYSLNGQSAALSYSGAVASYTLTAGQGSFTLTGFDALFTVIVPVFETTPRFSNTRRVGAARLGYATDTLSTPRLGHKIDAVPTRRLGARTK